MESFSCQVDSPFVIRLVSSYKDGTRRDHLILDHRSGPVAPLILIVQDAEFIYILLEAGSGFVSRIS